MSCNNRGNAAYALAENRLTTPLFDTSRYTRHLEAAFTEIRARHQAGAPPAHIDVQRADRGAPSGTPPPSSARNDPTNFS